MATYGPIGMVYKGEWAANATYALLNVVTQGGSAYVYRAPAPSAGNPLPVWPETVTAYWGLIAQGGLDAYAIAVQGGFAGSRDDWLDSLMEPAVTAAATANAAAERADMATSAAGEVTTAATGAAQAADAAALKLSGVDLSVKMLPPSAAPTAAVAQSERQTTFSLGIPKSNVAMATFEVDANAHLIMTTPEGLDNVGFAINRDNGHLEVTING